MKENKKKSRKIVLYVFLILFLASVSFEIVLAQVNYAHNTKQQLVMQDNLILNQDKYKNFRFGVLSADENCCGAIATYNFLTLNNKQADFNKIMHFYDVAGSTLYGVLGINPFVMQIYLNLNGFYASLTTNKKEMHNLAKNSGTSILMYFHNSGAHYITLEYNQEDDNFFMYNYYYGYIVKRTINDVFESRPNNGGLAMLLYVS